MEWGVCWEWEVWRHVAREGFARHTSPFQHAPSHLLPPGLGLATWAPMMWGGDTRLWRPSGPGVTNPPIMGPMLRSTHSPLMWWVTGERASSPPGLRPARHTPHEERRVACRSVTPFPFPSWRERRVRATQRVAGYAPSRYSPLTP